MSERAAGNSSEDNLALLSTRTRLWFSYQRFGLLVLVASVAIPALVYQAYPDQWAVWGALGLLGAFGLTMAVRILSKFRHKLRVTAMLVRRYGRNGFSPVLLQRYADDPCYRVVCNEIMRQVGVASPERRRVLRQLKDEAGRPMLFVADPETGALVEKRSHPTRDQGWKPSTPHAPLVDRRGTQ